jgi:hypothetical protein
MQRNKEENTCKFGTHVECGQGAGGLRSFIIAIRLIGVLNPSSPGHLTSPGPVVEMLKSSKFFNFF